MITKDKKCFSLPIELLGELSRISLLKGLNESEICEKALHMYMVKCSEISTVERMIHGDKVLNSELDSMLSVLNLTSNSDILRKFEVVLNEIEGLSKQNILYSRRKLLEQKVFDILRAAEEYDMTVFQQLSKRLTGKVKQTYLSLYMKT